MIRSPLALAALATVAVPGLDAVDVRRPRHPSSGNDAAVVIDAEGRRWVVRAPQNAAAGAALEAEVGLLKGLAAQVDAGRLPFDVPRPTGFAELPEGGRAVVHPQLPGRPLRLEDLGPGPGLAAEVGRAIAAIHELSPDTVEDAGLPVYEADAYRQRRLSEVDEAARTGLVPTGLLNRWEHALEDVALWRFRPVVVHGDLSADHVLCSADRPVAVLGWSEAKVADPADDLAWLLVAAPHEGVDAILEAYTLRRTEMRDPHLADRALLAGELALARWLLNGVRLEDQAIIDDATAMLAELAEHAELADAVATPIPDEAELGEAELGLGEAELGLGEAELGAFAPEPVVEADLEPEPVAEAEPVVEADLEPEPVAEAEPVVEAEAERSAAPAPEAPFVPVFIPSATRWEPQPEPEPEPRSDPEPEPEPNNAVADQPDTPDVVPAILTDVQIPAVIEATSTDPAADAHPTLALWDRVLDAEQKPPTQAV